MTRQNQRLPNALLTEAEVAEEFGCSNRSLQAWRQSGEGPVFLKIKGMIRYRASDIASFLAVAERTSTKVAAK
jgi:predicted site-specific integrase-resolvase